MNNFTGPMMGDGMMITGNWFNPRTGEHVTVRDSYIDGDQMILVLTNGKRIDLSEFQEYVQMSDDEYDANGRNLGKAKPATTQPTKPVIDESLLFDGMEKTVPAETELTPDNDEDVKVATGINEKAVLVATAEKVTKETCNKKMYEVASNGPRQLLKEVFDKAHIELKLETTISNFPDKDVEVIRRVFNATNDDIAAVLIDKFVNYDTIKLQIYEFVTQMYPNEKI